MTLTKGQARETNDLIVEPADKDLLKCVKACKNGASLFGKIICKIYDGKAPPPEVINVDKSMWRRIKDPRPRTIGERVKKLSEKTD